MLYIKSDIVRYDGEFSSWLISAKRGDTFCYHIGPLLGDTLLKKVVYRAYENGFVTLVQRRDGKKKSFSYLAQRTRRK